MNDDIKALIERGSEVSLLREGAHGSTVRAVSYPEHEHTSLTNKGKRVQTHLNMMLTSRKVDLKHIPEADRSRIREQKTNAPTADLPTKPPRTLLDASIPADPQAL